jgi:hypothetical protein
MVEVNKMETHFELNDDVFEQQFKDCSLNPALFNHEAHLRLAWIHIKKYGVDNAIENICEQLIEFTNSVGASNKYNKTLTIAAVKAVNHFINKTDIDNFQNFIQAFPRLTFNFKELMAFHYQIDIFILETAKKEYIEPDLLPFT